MAGQKKRGAGARVCRIQCERNDVRVVLQILPLSPRDNACSAMVGSRPGRRRAKREGEGKCPKAKRRQENS